MLVFPLGGHLLWAYTQSTWKDSGSTKAVCLSLNLSGYHTQLLSSTSFWLIILLAFFFNLNLFLAAMGLFLLLCIGYCLVALSRGCPLAAVHRLLIAVASPAAGDRL